MATRTQRDEELISDIRSAITRNFERSNNLHIARMAKTVGLEVVFKESFRVGDQERICVGLLATYPGELSRLYSITCHTSLDKGEYSDQQLVEHFRQLTGIDS